MTSAPGLAALDEPVRRYFDHAIRGGPPHPDRVHLTMTGRIKVGLWLPFVAAQEVDGRSFEWRARVGWGPLTPLRVLDRYADGAASTEGRLLGLARLFHDENADTIRSAAGRAALESVVFAPHCCLSERGVQWRAERDDLIVATFDLPPERPEVRVRIDHRGAMCAVIARRWGPAGGKRFDYVPCGAEVHAERRFGDLVLPASLSVGWWFDTPRYAPFFEAEIVSLAASP